MTILAKKKKKKLPKDSVIVKAWVDMIMAGVYKFNEAPNLADLRERVQEDVVKIWVGYIVAEEYTLEDVPEDDNLRGLVEEALKNIE